MTELANQTVTKQLRGATATSRIMSMVLEGELDRTDANDVVDMLAKLVLEGVIEVVIDFSDVTHFDYRGVQPLVWQAELLRDMGGDVKLAGLSPYIHAIFRSAGAHESFDYFSDAAQAVRSFDRLPPLYG